MGSEMCIRDRALTAHVTAPLSSGRAARSRRKSQLGYFLFGSVARLPGNSVWTQTVSNGTDDHESPRSFPTVPTRPNEVKTHHTPTLLLLNIDLFHTTLVNILLKRSQLSIGCRFSNLFNYHSNINQRFNVCSPSLHH